MSKTFHRSVCGLIQSNHSIPRGSTCSKGYFQNILPYPSLSCPSETASPFNQAVSKSWNQLYGTRSKKILTLGSYITIMLVHLDSPHLLHFLCKYMDFNQKPKWTLQTLLSRSLLPPPVHLSISQFLWIDIFTFQPDFKTDITIWLLQTCFD